MVLYADVNYIRCKLPIVGQSMQISLWPTPVDYSLRTCNLSTAC